VGVVFPHGSTYFNVVIMSMKKEEIRKVL